MANSYSLARSPLRSRGRRIPKHLSDSVYLAAVAPCCCCCISCCSQPLFPDALPLPSAGVGGFYCQDDTMKHQVAVHQRLFREIECGRLLHPVHPSGFKGVFQFCKIFVPIFCYPYVFCIHISHLSTASQTTEGSWWASCCPCCWRVSSSSSASASIDAIEPGSFVKVKLLKLQAPMGSALE